MSRPTVARLALALLAVALLWTGIAFVAQQEVVVWTDVEVDGDTVTSEESTVNVYVLGLVLLSIGLLVTATILIFEAYIRPSRTTVRPEPDAGERAE